MAEATLVNMMTQSANMMNKEMPLEKVVKEGDAK
jgi:hypothetical protein